MLNDLISDGLTRIRNASMRRLDTTKLLHSNVVESVLKILAEKGYIESYNLIEEDNKKFINVVLKYNEHGKSAINEIRKILKDYEGSTPVVFFEEETRRAFGTDSSFWIDDKSFDEIQNKLIAYTKSRDKIILK